jgi:energy-coupling factor transporter ATP-binding protein EcfA2
MTDWKWNGSRWWKFDFHAHTPASDDYGKGPDQAALKSSTPKKWLLDYMRAGIDCVAIADHNTGAWIDELKSALAEMEREQPKGYRPVHLFPGVEISVNGGVHILAILGRDKTTSDIDSLLGAVGFSGTKGSSDDVTSKSFGEVVSEIGRMGGIAIPAHVDGASGLLKVTGPTLSQNLNCEQVFAMEVVDPFAAKPQVYSDKKPPWTEVLGSDAHHPSGDPGQRYAGSHFTWVKMGTPCLEGLQLALLDGSLSVRRSDREPGDPNEHAPLAIEALEISEARYMGHKPPFTLNFNPWLNAIIGGRGTGKSTLVEFLRLVLRRDEELPQTLQGDFSKYFKTYASRDDDGLLTENSHFTIIYRKNGARYKVQWSQRGDAEPIHVENDDGSWKPEQGDVAQRFPARIYSQKQIFELAKAPLALLGIVDDTQEVDRRSWEEKWKAEETKFLSLRAKAREIESGLADEPRLRGEMEDVGRKLAVFEQAGHADVLKEYQKHLRQQRAVEEWEKTWADAGERVRAVADEIIPDSLEASVFIPEASEDKDLLAKVASFRVRVEQIGNNLKQLAEKLDEAASSWKSERDQSDWKRAVDSAINQYKDLLERLQNEGAGDPSVYGELVQRRQMLEARLKEISSKKNQLESVRKESEECLGRLLEIRRDLTKRRSAFLQKVLQNNPYVRIEVVPYGARDTVEAEFRSLIQRETGGFEKDIGPANGEGLLGRLYPGEWSQEKVEKRLKDLKQRVRTIASGNLDGIELGDRRFATHLAKLAPEPFDRLDLWFPEDSLKVEYSTTADGNQFRSIQEGSPGQKTAALLAFLLSYGEVPIVLDQPEDDLDNHLIYNLIVAQLREVKPHRQVVVVTHNANIVVNGDAELVVALAALGGQTQMECLGSLQKKNVRETICMVMEGGRKAFEQRYRRIALEGRHV